VTAWPRAAEVAVSLTFDVDAESGWLQAGPEYERRLSTLSDARYGVVRGLPRILSLLDQLEVPATFYIPGDTAIRHTAALQSILAAGHEVGHHGHRHLASHTIDAATQRAEMVDGLAALREHLGVEPRGYRSPAWELTPDTFELLLEFGFAYDSSCMGDDRPYLEQLDGRTLFEFPVHWHLDDWPYLAWHPSTSGNLTPPSQVKEMWLAEFEVAAAERRHITYTMHPEVTGRGLRAVMLNDLIVEMRERANVWFASHREVHAFLQGQPEAAG
jgi:peptidoglycan/xylan/chitin deacetylase (PgdA/CDA1 family)